MILLNCLSKDADSFYDFLIEQTNTRCVRIPAWQHVTHAHHHVRGREYDRAQIMSSSRRRTFLSSKVDSLKSRKSNSPNISSFCPHCERCLSTKTFKRHQMLFYNDETDTWTLEKEIASSSSNGKCYSVHAIKDMLHGFYPTRIMYLASLKGPHPQQRVWGLGYI